MRQSQTALSSEVGAFLIRSGRQLVRHTRYSLGLVALLAENEPFAASAQSHPVGTFDSYLVYISWSDYTGHSCVPSPYVRSTNTANPLSQVVNASGNCFYGTATFGGQFTVAFPPTTPTGTISPDGNSFILDRPMSYSFGSQGSWTIGNIYPTNTLAHFLNTATAWPCPDVVSINGPPLAPGAYPVSLNASCTETNLGLYGQAADYLPFLGTVIVEVQYMPYGNNPMMDGIFEAQPLYRVPLPRSIDLIAIEVNQAIQDWSNSVPLVQNKATVVRAFVQLSGTNRSPVTVQGARLRGFRNGTELVDPASGNFGLTALNAGGSLTVTTNNIAPLRGQFGSSLNFLLPDAWTTGALNLRFDWTNGKVADHLPNGVSNATVRVAFITSAVPQVKFVTVNWTNGAGGPFMAVSDASAADLPRRLLSIYPVSRVDSIPATMTWTTNAKPTLDHVNSQLSLMRTFDGLMNLLHGGGGNRIYYGAIAETTNFNGLAVDIPSVVASGELPTSFFAEGRHTHSHEIGHTLGREHDVSVALFGYKTNVWRNGAGFTTNISARGHCSELGATNAVYPLFQPIAAQGGALEPAFGPMTNGVNALIYGLDTLTLTTTMNNPVIDPNLDFDLMSYCSSPAVDLWIGTANYNALSVAINSNFVTAAVLHGLLQLTPWGFETTTLVVPPVIAALIWSRRANVPNF